MMPFPAEEFRREALQIGESPCYGDTPGLFTTNPAEDAHNEGLST